MGEQDDGSALVASAHHPPGRSAPNRRVTGRCIDHACFDSGLREDLREKRREGLLVAGRVGGLDLNRLREQFRDAVFGALEICVAERDVAAIRRAPLNGDQ